MHEEAMAVLRVYDIVEALDWYARLGFVQQWTHREPGRPALVCLARGEARLLLSELTGDARPDSLVYLRTQDVEAIAERFGVRAHNRTWGRECELVDPSGNRLRVGAPPSI